MKIKHKEYFITALLVGIVATLIFFIVLIRHRNQEANFNACANNVDVTRECDKLLR